MRKVGRLLLGNSLQESIHEIHEALRDRAVEFLGLRLLGIEPGHNVTPRHRLGE